MSHALPEAFLSKLRSYPGHLFDDIEAALASEPTVSVRTNPAKTSAEVNREYRRVPWCIDGYYLDERPRFTLDPALHAGRYYVQDASSMFIRHVLTSLIDRPVAYLDACAAPGGKSLCALDSLPAGSIVVSNEATPARAAVLRENIIKWGNPASIVTRADARAFRRLKERFDVIAADVPCSGEGMMRKNETAVSQWSPALVADCTALQRDIVDSLWLALRPGGLLIYSTCTFNREENELLASHIVNDLGGEPVAISIDPDWGISPGIDTEIPCYRFIPGKVDGEGLFMIVIRKPGYLSEPKSKPTKIKPLKGFENVGKWLHPDAGLSLALNDNRINAFPPHHLPLLKEIGSTQGIDIIHHGVVVATIKGRDMIPSHSLALSTALNRDAFPTVEIDRETALNYLRCESIELPESTPRGFCLLVYENSPLGFVKNLGNRVNSLYPRDWRIRHL